jgi:hypothetical protein
VAVLDERIDLLGAENGVGHGRFLARTGRSPRAVRFLPSSSSHWPDVPSARRPRARPLSAPPGQFLVRAVAVITGLTMLLIVDVRGVAFYFAWALIVLALVTEGLGTFVYWRRSRANRGP